MHREQALALLWPDQDLPSTGNLRTALHRLRALLDDPLDPVTHVALEGEWLVLHPLPGGEPPADWWDAEAFEHAVDLALGGKDRERCRTALAQYHGDFLPADLYDEWAGAVRDRLQGRRLALLLHFAQLSHVAGDLSEATDLWQAALVEHPTSEEAARGLMRLYVAAGRRTEAVRVFRRLGETLLHDLDTAPDPETQAVFQAILENTPQPSMGDAGKSARSIIQPPVDALLTGATWTPLIGMRTERAQMRRRLAHARSGRGGLVLLRGPAGSGKSRLLAELLRESLDRHVLVLYGRAYRQEGQLAYGPLLEALREYLRVQDRDVIARQCAEQAGALLGLLPEIGRALPDVQPLPPVEPAAERHRLFAALVGLFRELSRDGMIVALEDLHWADTTTIQALHYLHRACHGMPMMLIGAYRAEDLDPDGALAALAQEVAETETLGGDASPALLDIRPLSASGVRALVEALLEPGQPDDILIELIAARTRGNPLFVRELVTTLREQQRLELSGDVWRLADDSASVVPASVRILIGERIGRMPAQSRQFLFLCAAVGRDVEYGLLRTVYGYDEGRLLDLLDGMSAMGLLEETARGYAFYHPLMQEAVYERIPMRRRSALHRHIAEAIVEARGSDTAAHAAELAWHFGEAGLHEQAAQFSLQAARQAIDASANPEAFKQLLQARRYLLASGASGEAVSAVSLRLGDVCMVLGRFADAQHAYAQARLDRSSPDQHAELWRKEGESWARRGDYSRALDAFAQASAVAPALPTLSAAIALSRGSVFERQGAYAAGAEAARAALAILGDTPRVLEAAQAHNLLGHIAFQQGDSGYAEQCYLRSMSIAEELGDARQTARNWNSLANVSLQRGEHAAAEGRYRQSLVFWERLGDQTAIAKCLTNLAAVAWLRSEYVAANSFAERGLAICEQIGDRWGAGMLNMKIGHISRSLGNYNRAEDAYRLGLVVWEAIGNLRGIAEAVRSLGMVAYERGDLPEAVRCCRQARRRARLIGSPYEQAFATLCLARAYRRYPRLRGARRWSMVAACLDHCAELATAHGLSEAAVRCALERAELYLDRNMVARAADAADRAFFDASQAGRRFDVALAQRLLGRCAAAGGASRPAVTHLATARDLFRTLGAKVEVARTEILLAQLLMRLPHLGGDDDAACLAEQACACFAAAGASWDLANAQRLLPRIDALV